MNDEYRVDKQLAQKKKLGRVAIELMDRKSARHDAAFYASYGLAAKYIAHQTGLRLGQVTYALKQAHVRITDYRNGLGNVATIVMRLTQQEVDDQLYKHLRKTL